MVLTFNERLEPAYTRVSVWDASGQQVDLKDGAVDLGNPKVVNVSLPPLQPGRYTVRYRVLSVDGHIVEASFAFFGLSAGTSEVTRAASGCESIAVAVSSPQR